jgi:plasmid stabilization system protein ParE
MKIIWSDFASMTLKQIFDYYKQNANISIARKIKKEILLSTKPLLTQPNSGQIELTLESLNEGHRYIVESNYKIVYKQVKEGVLITDVFDCQQDPIKINDETRKPSR